jgi:hypothetical protein
MAITTVLTSKGREVVAGRMLGATPTQAEPKNIGWGIGASTAAVTDVGMSTEAAEARVVGTSSLATTTTSNDTYQVVGTITSASNQTVTEAVLTDSSTKPPTTTLSAAITTTGQTSITVASAAGFPGSGNYNIQIEAEVLTVTAGQGSTTWTVTRGVNGSTAATHSTSTPIVGGNAPGSTAVTGGTVYAKSTYTGLALNTGDSIAYTFQAAHS